VWDCCGRAVFDRDDALKEGAAAILDKALRTTIKEEDGATLVHTYQDVEPHIEYAKKCRRVDSEDRGRFGKRGDLRRTMSIPMSILMQVCQENRLDFYNKEDAKKILKIVKRDYPVFKTTNDKI
jgi:hypothetical protein